MPFSRARRHRRSIAHRPCLLLLGFVVLFLAPVLHTIGGAQALPASAQPTAPVTETFEPSLAAAPSPTPTPRVTEEPAPPDEVQANPTAVPATEPVVDDIAPNPGPGTVTLTKGVCDDSGFDPYAATGLDAFQEACSSPDGEFEFTVANGAGFAETATTSLGSVQFTVPSGTLAINETIPEGFGDPVVFCWSNLLPAPADRPFIGNGPSWNVADGEQVECRWFNVSASAQPTHTIRAAAYGCPEGTDSAPGYWHLAATCTVPLTGIDFTLAADGASFGGATGDAGAIEWTGVDLGGSGQVQIDEAIPAGYGEPVVWCVSYPVIAADAQDFDVFEVAAADGLVTVTPEPHEPYTFSCTYFNVMDGAAPGDLAAGNLQEGQLGNTVTVVKRRCPMGVVEDAGLDDYQEICTGEHDDIAFTLDHSGGSFPGTTADGQVQWTNVPLGDFTIQETVPAGFLDPLVWCGFIPSIALPAPMPASGGLIAGSFESGASEYVCYVFNIPDPDANSTITIYTHACPAGTVPDSDDNDYYKANCPDRHPGVEFTLTAPHGVFPETADGDGMVEWTGLPVGETSIQETIPQGYGEPVVLCDFADDVLHGLPFEGGPLSRIQSPGGLIPAPVEEPNVAYRCSWFNIPLAGEPVSRVAINKRTCPADVDFVLTDDNVINDVIVACPTLGDGIEFTLDNANGSSTQAIDGDGDTYWDDVPLGPFTVTESIPAGYGEPVWYCAFNYYENGEIVHAPPVSADAPGGVHAASFDDPLGGVYYCWVFNVPVEEENGLTILKWRCPEGAGYDEDQAWYEANCVEEHDGVEFTVASDIGIAVMETAGGSVQFDGLPTGAVGIQETVPDGFGAPVVYCATDAGWDAYPAPTGHWEFEFAADGLDQALACHVYNIIPGEPGSVTLLKWTCPAGYNLDAAGADPKADCTDATNGIGFQFGLAGLEEEAELQTTGDLIDGGVVFEGLDPDTWKAVEVVPEGIAEVFVLECTGHIMGVLQPYPLQLGNVLEIELDAGEHLTCHWYNVPETQGGSLTVVKYTCSTETFVSEVDCQIFEDGETFDLLHWNVGDGAWEVIDTEVTDGVGVIAWTGLDAGDYGLDEHDGDWCHLATQPVFGPGDFFSVFAGEETVVSVYNCDGEPGTAGETPTKYPNTGIPPASGDDRRHP